MKTGFTTSPLHWGQAPSWLFKRMTKLSREITKAIVFACGPDEYLQKLSDPYWFQAFGCVLGFDWHSSGLTTTVTGAIKEGIKGLEEDLGLYACGGKGKTSRKTPKEIQEKAPSDVDRKYLVYSSKMSAKIDSAAVQDGYQLYHHAFFFTKSGNWAVVQQGMNDENRMARRYHWLSDNIEDSFVEEPHSAICSDIKKETLNMVAKDSSDAQNIVTKLAISDPAKIDKTLTKLKEYNLPKRHWIALRDINPRKISQTLMKAPFDNPKNFENVLSTEGIGPKTIRSLSLIAEIIYGEPPSYTDPARFSFAHGGKDGIPYPVDRKNYDNSIKVLKRAVDLAKLDRPDKLEAFRRLSKMEF